MSNQSNNSNWKLIAGLAGGAALGWWLNTDKGREFRKETSAKLNEFGNVVSETTQREYANAAENVKSAIESSKKTLNNTLETGKGYAASIAETAKSKLNTGASQAEEVIDDAESAFDRGARKAKIVINKKAALAKEVVSS
jgi:hypothetical protein